VRQIQLFNRHEQAGSNGEEMSDFLRILENEIQIAALSFLALVYIFRIIWLLKFTYKNEKTYPAGSTKAGVAYSMMNVAMPWAMESSRKKPSFYAQFVIFHIGIAAAITASFIIPYWPELFKIKAVVILFQVSVGAALIVGLMRLIRRISNPALRLISTMDDYASLILMILFFATGILAIPNRYETNEWPLIFFFAITAFLLVYVPFSKIGHYIYYPFTRYFLGKTMGHRGIHSSRKSREKRNRSETRGVLN
jgi:nitrate reductase gamma subunit